MIILASQSPRRQELLKLTGLPFIVRAADVDDKGRKTAREAAQVMDRRAALFIAEAG